MLKILLACVIVSIPLNPNDTDHTITNTDTLDREFVPQRGPRGSYGITISRWKLLLELGPAIFNPAGDHILTTFSNGTMKLWDLHGRCVTIFNGHHTEVIDSAVFNPTGDRILTISWGCSAKLWNLRGQCLATLREDKSRIDSAVFSPAGNHILTVSSSDEKRKYTVKLWDLNGKYLANLQEHTEYINSAIFNPTEDCILTASSGTDKTAKLWRSRGTTTTTFLRRFLEYCTGSTRLAPLFQKQEAQFLSYGESAIFNPVGDRVLTICGRPYPAKLWDLRGNCLATLSGHTKSINSAVFNSNGDRILTASEDDTTKLWGLDGKCLVTFHGHTNEVYSAVFNLTDDRILTASADGTTKLWDLNGNCLITFAEDMGEMTSAIFSPDGNHILTTSTDGLVKLWDLCGACLITFVNPATLRFGWSPDGYPFTSCLTKF